MKFDYSRIIDVPVGFAFDQATDFNKFEAVGIGSMSPFVPTGDIRAPQIGARWKITSEFQGRDRRYSLELRELVKNERVVLGNGSQKFDVEAVFTFTPAQNEATLFGFAFEASAKTITGRLILQTLQLARGRIEGKMSESFDKMATEIESSHQST